MKKTQDSNSSQPTLSHVLRNASVYRPSQQIYTAIEVAGWFTTNEIRHPYSRKGTPYANAGLESFHDSLKKEEIYTTTYLDFEEANQASFSSLEGVYTYNRIHIVR